MPVAFDEAAGAGVTEIEEALAVLNRQGPDSTWQKFIVSLGIHHPLTPSCYRTSQDELELLVLVFNTPIRCPHLYS